MKFNLFVLGLLSAGVLAGSETHAAQHKERLDVPDYLDYDKKYGHYDSVVTERHQSHDDVIAEGVKDCPLKNFDRSRLYNFDRQRDSTEGVVSEDYDVSVKETRAHKETADNRQEHNYGEHAAEIKQVRYPKPNYRYANRQFSKADSAAVVQQTFNANPINLPIDTTQTDFVQNIVLPFPPQDQSFSTDSSAQTSSAQDRLILTSVSGSGTTQTALGTKSLYLDASQSAAAGSQSLAFEPSQQQSIQTSIQSITQQPFVSSSSQDQLSQLKFDEQKLYDSLLQQQQLIQQHRDEIQSQVGQAASKEAIPINIQIVPASQVPPAQPAPAVEQIQVTRNIERPKQIWPTRQVQPSKPVQQTRQYQPLRQIEVTRQIEPDRQLITVPEVQPQLQQSSQQIIRNQQEQLQAQVDLLRKQHQFYASRPAAYRADDQQEPAKPQPTRTVRVVRQTPKPTYKQQAINTDNFASKYDAANIVISPAQGNLVSLQDSRGSQIAVGRVDKKQLEEFIDKKFNQQFNQQFSQQLNQQFAHRPHDFRRRPPAPRGHFHPHPQKAAIEQKPQNGESCNAPTQHK